MGASLRYLSQRFTAPNRICMGVLNDVGTEELAHLEMVSKIVHQLTANMTMEEIECSGFAPYYVDHTAGVWSQAAGGVADPIRFLRAREVVHYQRFGEAKSTYTSKKIKELFLEISVVLFSIRFSFCFIRCSR